MTNISPTAVIADGAQVSKDAKIGHFCVIGKDAVIAEGVTLHSHVVVEGRTSIGEGTEVFPFTALGHIPQDKKFGGESCQLEIGKFNMIRENVTMHPGTAGDKCLTVVGDHNLFMIGSHVAHDCVVGSHVIFANNATLAGHCHVGDYAIMGGLSAAHQFVRIGENAFIGGMTGVENDVIPFGMVMGNRAALVGLNIVGLRRREMDKQDIQTLRKAYRMMFSEEGTLKERIEDVEKMFGEDAGVKQIIDFIRAESSRSLCTPRSR